MTSPGEALERQQFKIGEDVHVEMIGTVKAVETGPDGKLRYVVEGGPSYMRCYVTQCQISRLPEPEDFDAKVKEASNAS